jgi:hypothetical protein
VVAALAREASAQDQRRQLQDVVGSVLSDIAKESTTGTDAAEEGKSLAEAAAKTLAGKATEDEQVAAARARSRQ